MTKLEALREAVNKKSIGPFSFDGFRHIREYQAKDLLAIVEAAVEMEIAADMHRRAPSVATALAFQKREDAVLEIASRWTEEV